MIIFKKTGEACSMFFLSLVGRGHWSKDNVKVHLKEIGWLGNWIDLSQDRYR